MTRYQISKKYIPGLGRVYVDKRGGALGTTLRNAFRRIAKSGVDRLQNYVRNRLPSSIYNTIEPGLTRYSSNLDFGPKQPTNFRSDIVDPLKKLGVKYIEDVADEKMEMLSDKLKGSGVKPRMSKSSHKKGASLRTVGASLRTVGRGVKIL